VLKFVNSRFALFTPSLGDFHLLRRACQDKESGDPCIKCAIFFRHEEKDEAKTKSQSRTFVPFHYIDSGILKTTRETLNGKADRAEGLLRLRDTDTLLITFREW
jgi:hypothetical protein